MHAIVNTRYGSPDVLRLAEVARPTPGEQDVLVRIYAAAANPLDWHRMRGAPFLVRLQEGLLRPRETILGADIAGRVEAVGAGVTQFRPGDAVFGGVSAGGFAEYAVAPAHALVLKPTGCSFEEAAAIPVAALTALQCLRDKGQLQVGQRVLVNGASGGVGTFAVQIAKALGAEVTGVCSARNLDLVRSIGADHVIDYAREDFTRCGGRYDLIVDLIANHSIDDYRRALTPQGRCVVAGFSGIAHLLQVALLGQRGGQPIGMMMAGINQPDLRYLAELVEVGKVRPVIDRRYPLREVAEAIRYLETGRARGKVVITVASGEMP
jgi:NADPH:quinone reductase-like Zn-dependent oxidoreductase